MGQSTWGVTFFSETLSGDFLFQSFVKENGINIVDCHLCHLIGMFVDESNSNNSLLQLPKSGLTTWRAVANSTIDHWTRGRRMPELRTLLVAASSTLKAVSLSWAGRTPLATIKICLEITKSWGWGLLRNEAASSSVRHLGTRMSRRQRLLLQCMESHSLTLRVLQWIPLRLL